MVFNNFKTQCLLAVLALCFASVTAIPFDPSHVHAYCGRDLEKSAANKAKGIEENVDFTKPTRNELNNHRLYFLYAGPCEQPYCSFEQNKQCGQDGKWYFNKCHMHASNVLIIGKDCDMNDENVVTSERAHDVKILRDYLKNKKVQEM